MPTAEPIPSGLLTLAQHRNEGQWPSYAWPGGYAIAYIFADGELCCPPCMNTQDEIHFQPQHNDQWRIVGWTHSGEADDTDDWICANCYLPIDVAQREDPSQDIDTH